MTAQAHDTTIGWDALPGQAPDSVRPRLHLVPTGRAARRSLTSPRRELAPVRISRFGRLLLTASVIVLAVAIAVTTSRAVFAAGAAPGIDHTVTVVSGQTLSGIAATELSDLPIAEGVAQLQVLNHLNTSQVHAGQTLAVPRR